MREEKKTCKVFTEDCYNHPKCMDTLKEEIKTPSQILQEAREEFEKKYGGFELCDIVNQKDHDRLLSFFTSTLQSFKESLLNEIDKLPTKYPELENNDFDAGAERFKRDVLSLLILNR